MTDSAPAGRTHDHREFDAADLARRKRRAGVSVDVIIPARDEEHTVHEVVSALRPLRDDVGLVDDLLVVDGESDDATARVAAAAGARVVRQSRVLPASGTAPGKGEALWKGLAATSGDLVAFVDADLHGVDERFVTGLVGPLLVDPDVALVKAAYDRPLQSGDVLHPTGGGRVTELLARPLLAAFWPELSWVAQPLSGEYAARRDLLEQLSFVQGYGVELAMLVDVAERCGAGSVAQVDLGQRVHEHQSLAALGLMAAELLHVALDRMVRQDRMRLADGLATDLPQPVRDELGRLRTRTRATAVGERQPLATYLAAGDVAAGAR